MEFQWLARYWAPDCSHSHIMRPGGILIILIILLVHFTTRLWRLTGNVIIMAKQALARSHESPELAVGTPESDRSVARGCAARIA